MSLKENYFQVKEKLYSINPESQLIVVTKTKPASILTDLHELKCKHIGENRIPELKLKADYAVQNNLNFEFHLIAPVQTNKLKLLNFPFHYHCLTDLRHLDQMMEKKIPVQNIFIQVNISKDEAKSGIEVEDLKNFLEEAQERRPIQGLMTILKQGLNEQETFSFYQKLKSLSDQFSLPLTSMGMSDDFELAAKAKASFVRVGSRIVGARS